MKKILFIFVALVTVFNINAQESRSLYERNKGIGFDYLLGTDYNSFMYGLAGYVEGFYVDILHGTWKINFREIDKDVTRDVYEPGDYEDGKSFAMHYGYYIPVVYEKGDSYKGFHYLRIAPVIGIWNRKYGITHIYSYNRRGPHRGYHGIFIKQGLISEFDFGVNVRYDFGDPDIFTFSLSTEITRHTLMFGMGVIF